MLRFMFGMCLWHFGRLFLSTRFENTSTRKCLGQAFDYLQYVRLQPSRVRQREDAWGRSTWEQQCPWVRGPALGPGTRSSLAMMPSLGPVRIRCYDYVDYYIMRPYSCNGSSTYHSILISIAYIIYIYVYCNRSKRSNPIPMHIIRYTSCPLRNGIRPADI